MLQRLIVCSLVIGSCIYAQETSNKEYVDAVQERSDYQSHEPWGLLSSIDLKECDPDIIRDAEKIKQYVVELCDVIEMKRYGECTVVHFGEDEKVAGYSMTQLIETSLISGHFANLTNAAYIDVFSCKAYDPEVVAEFSQQFFKAKTCTFTTVVRD